MKLITPELEQRFLEVGDQSEVKDPLFIAKFFNSCGSGRWYATEYDKETNTCYGYVTGSSIGKWCSFSISDIEKLDLSDFRIERDVHFKEQTYEQVILKKTQHRMEALKKDPSQKQEQDIEH